jgi:hypothetical protein
MYLPGVLRQQHVAEKRPLLFLLKSREDESRSNHDLIYEVSMAATTSPATRSTRRPTPKTTMRPLRADVVAAVIDPEHRRALIAQIAYYRAERRGFEPGHEAEDWLSAEAEVDTALTLGVMKSGN